MVMLLEFICVERKIAKTKQKGKRLRNFTVFSEQLVVAFVSELKKRAPTLIWCIKKVSFFQSLNLVRNYTSLVTITTY